MFPYSLGEGPKDWFNNLRGNLDFNEVARWFKEKYYPHARLAAIRRELSAITQKPNEALHEYHERFTRLCEECPSHNLDEAHLLHQFIQGLSYSESQLLNASAGGSISNKPLDEVKKLIETMASNSQSRRNVEVRVNACNDLNVDMLNDKLELIMKALAKDETKTCGVCLAKTHHTDECPSVEEKASAMYKKFDNSNTYHPNLRNHPNFSWSNPNNAQPDPYRQTVAKPATYQHPNATQAVQKPISTQDPNQELKIMMEGMMAMMKNQEQSIAGLKQDFGGVTKNMDSLTHEVRQNATNTNRQMGNLETQVSQIATRVNALETQGSSRLQS